MKDAMAVTLRVLALILFALPALVRGHVCQVAGTSADCRGRSLTSVPSDLPYYLTSLDLSNNKIRQLTENSFQNYGLLEELILRGNKLSGSYDFQNGAVFQPLVALRSLDLGENQLTEVGNHSFSGLRQLQRLLLNHNLLQRLQPCAFCGLASLRHLQLQANQLHSGNESFSTGVFCPVNNLTTLHLSKNFAVGGSGYPSSAMAPLIRLESLTFDLLPEPLPEVFSTFQLLTSLTLWNQNGMSSISNETFSSLAEVPLKHLQLTGQDLYFLHRDAFQPVSQHLQQLEVVDLPSLSLPYAIEALHVFQGRNMSLIRLEGLSGFSGLFPNDTADRHIITAANSEIFSNICVTNITLARNMLTFINTDPLPKGCLHKTIKYLDMHGNFLIGFEKNLGTLIVFQKLEYLDVSSNIERHAVPQKSTFLYSRADKSTSVSVLLPPNLVYCNISHGIANIGKLDEPFLFRNASHLRVLDVSYCDLFDFVAPIKGLERLEEISVSGNDLSNLSPSFSENFGDLRKLSMNDASLTSDFIMQLGPQFFGNMKKLHIIEISGNKLRSLPDGIFNNMSEVILSRNSFTLIPMAVDRMRNVLTLDLTFNSITFLTSQQREQLDARAQTSNGSFHLLLEGNPLICDCSVLDFVSWLSSTSVRLDRGGNYSCITDGGAFTTTAEVAANLDGKWRQCVGSWWLGVASALLVVTLMTLVLVFVLVRSWTSVQHVVLRMLGFGHALLRRADFRYDVHVAYSDEDYRFACLDLLPLLEADGLRVYVKDRDEPVGVSRAEEVVRAVGKSWRIVFLLTEAFLRDEWCQFTALTAARCSASPHGPGRVLLVLLRPLPRADLPPSLLTVVEEQDVFDLGGDHPGPALWGRLLHRLREE